VFGEGGGAVSGVQPRSNPHSRTPRPGGRTWALIATTGVVGPVRSADASIGGVASGLGNNSVAAIWFNRLNKSRVPNLRRSPGLVLVAAECSVPVQPGAREAESRWRNLVVRRDCPTPGTTFPSGEGVQPSPKTIEPGNDSKGARSSTKYSHQPGNVSACFTMEIVCTKSIRIPPACNRMQPTVE
jgi:hypothetical protein